MGRRSNVPGTPTTIGCPDCSGVLNMDKEGDGHRPRYICQVGHSFSVHSLLEAKEDQLEEAWWSVTSLLQHVAMICADLKAELPTSDLSRELDRRIAEVRAQEEDIRAMIANSVPPSIDGIPERQP